MKTVGIVLAAGASQRMGSPKSLLCGTDGIPLAVKQAAVLMAGGCSSVAVVLGAEAEVICHKLPDDLAVVVNPRWAEGRATSLQAGANAFLEAGGWLFLPVDAAGVKPETIRMILGAVENDPTAVWRPVHQGIKGNLLWISQESRAGLMQLPPGARVDEWAQPLARELEVDDPAILRNVNTPEEWAALVREDITL